MIDADGAIYWTTRKQIYYLQTVSHVKFKIIKLFGIVEQVKKHLQKNLFMHHMLI